MNKRSFGRTGLLVSPLGFGGAPVGLLKTDQERINLILNTLLDAGVNLIDTAASYQGSEPAIAAAIGHRRGEYLLVSKCGSAGKSDDAPAWSEKLILLTVDASLERLKTDVLDVMLLHSCDLETLKKGDALAALVKARQAGKIRFAGYSGDNEAAAYAAGLPEVAVLETSVSIADQFNIGWALPIAEKHNVGVLAKRPIANAAWKAKNQQQGFYADYAQTYHDRLEQMKLNPKAFGMDWPELALRFILGFPAVHCAIIGTTNPENARQNIAAANQGPLPAPAVEAVRARFRECDPQNQWHAQG